MQCREDKPFCSGLYFQRLQFGEWRIRTEKLQASKHYYVAVKRRAKTSVIFLICASLLLAIDVCPASRLMRESRSAPMDTRTSTDVYYINVTTLLPVLASFQTALVNCKERLATNLATLARATADLRDSEPGCTSRPHKPSLTNKCDIHFFLPCQFIKKEGLDKVFLYWASLCSVPLVLFNHRLFWSEWDMT